MERQRLSRLIIYERSFIHIRKRMDGGEHWFHTEEQMRFLDDWIIGNV